MYVKSVKFYYINIIIVKYILDNYIYMFILYNIFEENIMKAINLYELTRVKDDDFIKFEAHLSQRGSLLKEKKCEIDSLKAFVENIFENIEYDLFSYFYFSYSIPQISKSSIY